MKVEFKIVFLLVYLYLHSGCVNKQKNFDFQGSREIPVYTINKSDSKEISFEKEIAFGRGDSVLLGSLSGFAVDSLNRVYIGDSERKTIHIFDSKGTYLSSIGREGRGPGEFIVTPHPVVVNNILYIYDPMQLRITAYSLESFEKLFIKNINPKNLYSIDSLKSYRMGDIKFRDDGKYLVGFKQVIHADPTQKSYNLDKLDVRYYLMDRNAKLIPRQIHRKQSAQFIPFPPECKRFKGGVVDGVANLPFLPKELVTFSSEGYIYSAWSDDFLIKIKDPEGELVKAIYYPFEKNKLEREDAVKSEFHDSRRCVAENMDLPDHWPAIHEIISDGKGNIWVSTNIRDQEKYEWWVLSSKGELQAKFTWPKESKIKYIRNGYLYTIEDQLYIRYNYKMK